MKKILLLTIVTGFLAFGLRWSLKEDKAAQPLVALVTTLSHPACEQIREGFLAHNQPSTLKFLDFNAEGSLQSAHLIAQQIAQNPHIIAILTIGTLAAQSIAQVEKKRPIIMAALSDPHALFPDLSDYKNICGLSDDIDAGFQLEVIASMLPTVKSISLLYSPHEINSSLAIKKLVHEAELKKLSVNLVGVYEPQQIAHAALRACKKSDAIVIPLDNQLVAAMPSVIKATKNQACPLITSNESPIHQGASIAFGVDYKNIGYKAREIMHDIIANNKTPQEIGFSKAEKPEIYVNNQALKEKNIKINLIS